MKRFSNILAVVFVLAALVGCENSVDTPAPNPGLDPNAKYILFDVGIEESRGVALNSADNDYFKQFSIYGYTYITGTRWNAWKTIAKPNVFDDVPEKVVKAGSYFSYLEENEDVSNLKTWDEGDGRYSFFAVYPEKAKGEELGSIAYPVTASSEGVPYVTYTRPDDATKMADLMTGAHIDPTYSENGSYVSFDMEHRLAAVDVVALNHYEFDHDSDPITPEKHVTIRITSLNVKFDNLLYTSADIYLDKVGVKGTPTVRYKPENSAETTETYTILDNSEAYYDVEPNNEDKNHLNISADREKTMFFIPQEMDSTTDETLEKTDIKATVTGTFEKWYDADGDGTLDTQIMEEYDEDGNLKDADGKFSINNQIKFNRHLEESYRYNVRLTFTSAAVSITVLTAEKWVDVPIYHEFH